MTDLRVGGTFLQVMRAGPTSLRVGDLHVSILSTSRSVPSINVGQMNVSVLSVHGAALRVGGTFVQVLRSVSHSPMFVGGMHADVLSTGTRRLRVGKMLVEVLRGGDNLAVGGLIVEVLRSAGATVGAGKFNRIVSVNSM